jgi:hypothetical protein
MTKRDSICALAVILLALSAAWGQDSSAQQPAGGAPDSSPQQPVPAFGPDNPAPPVNENPPISGLDMPNLEPHAAPLSYLQPGVHLSQSVDSNIENTLGGSGIHTITDALGSLELQRLWSHYDLALDYLGGVAYYNVNGLGLKQIEELGLDQKINWKRGQLSLRDAFSYQPEGTFGSSYGSVGSTGAALGGQGMFFGGGALGALGQVPRIMNLSLVSLVENLTPKSSVTVTGGYGFVHFLESNPGAGNSFIGSSQVTGQVGYDRVFGPHDQGAITYAYQGFNFSTGVAFHSHVIQLMWGHRISGRMDFLIGAGPQITQIDNLPTVVPATMQSLSNPSCLVGITNQGLLVECPENDRRLSTAGRASLRYRFPKTSLDLSYDHYITSGSGFFAGAESDIARLDVTRPLGRVWTAFSDIGYSRNRRVSSLTTEQLATCTPTLTNPNPPACPGITANTYQYGFAGVGLRRMIGHSFRVFASYQFNDLAFDSSFCTSALPCSRISQRHVGMFGLDWTPRPIRID